MEDGHNLLSWPSRVCSVVCQFVDGWKGNLETTLTDLRLLGTVIVDSFMLLLLSLIPSNFIKQVFHVSWMCIFFC